MTIKDIWTSFISFWKTIYHKIYHVIDSAVFWYNRKIQALVDSHAFRKLSKWYISLKMPGHPDLPLAQVLYNFGSNFKQGQVWQRSKGLAFSLMMAIPPLMIFLFSLIAYLPVEGIWDELLEQLRIIIPENISERVDDTVIDVLQHRHRSLQSIGFITSVILAAMGVHGLLQSMNYANNFVNRNKFVVRFTYCILIVLLLFVLMAVTFSLLLGYKHIIVYLVGAGIIAKSRVTMLVFSFVRWLLMVLSILLVLNIFYRFALGSKQRKYIRFFSIGSVLSTGLFFVLAWGFKIYLNNFANFNLLYGSIGTLLVVMVWVFANCYVLLVGYQMNGAIIKGIQHPDDWTRVQYNFKRKYWEKRYKRLRVNEEESRRLKNKARAKQIKKEKEYQEQSTVKVNLEVTLQHKDGQWRTISTKIINKES